MFTKKLDGSLLLMALLISFPAFGTEGPGIVPGKCSLATLRGTFGTLEQGTVLGQLPGLPAPPWPAADIATATYDGAGNFSGSYTASFNGVTATGTLAGTYTVNADCTYADEFTLTTLGVTFHRAGAVSGGPLLRKIDYIYTDSSMVAWGTLKKTPPGGCSPANFRGTYVGVAQGTFTAQVPGNPPPPFPVEWTALFTADGVGSFSGAFTMNFGGFVVTSPVSATYTVNPDCTSSFVDTNNFGTAHEAGVITGLGDQQEIAVILTDGGQVTFQRWTKQ